MDSYVSLTIDRFSIKFTILYDIRQISAPGNMPGRSSSRWVFVAALGRLANPPPPFSPWPQISRHIIDCHETEDWFSSLRFVTRHGVMTIGRDTEVFQHLGSGFSDLAARSL